MKRTLCITLGLTLTAAAISVHAQRISPQPEPGLWRSEAKTLINGQDLQAGIRAAQEEMLNNLPAEQRDMMRKMLGADDSVGVEMECITAQEAADLTNPDALIERANQDMQNCTMEIEPSGESTLRIRGNCVGGEGFTGDMQGELTMISRHEMHTRFTGKGMADIGSAEDVPESMRGMVSDQPVDIEHSEVSTWVSEDCGDLAPDAATGY